MQERECSNVRDAALRMGPVLAQQLTHGVICNRQQNYICSRRWGLPMDALERETLPKMAAEIPAAAPC